VVPGYCSPWSDGYLVQLKSAFEKCATINVDVQPEANSDNLFWTANLYVSEKSPSNFRYISHFVELYGFSRNSSAVFLVIGLLSLIRKWVVYNGNEVAIPNYCIFYSCLFAAYFLAQNYTKLLRRHNDLILRAFIVSVSSLNEGNGEDK
jgi:hypothetical protein